MNKKRKTEDSEGCTALVKTTVFVVSFTPYKATLSLPCKSRISREEVAEAAVKQGVHKPQSLPRGHFEVIYNNNHYQVAVYKFMDVVGCRTTGSVQHSY